MPIKLGRWGGRHVHGSQGGGEARRLAQPTEVEVFAVARDIVPLIDVPALIKGNALGLKVTCLEAEIAGVCGRALGPDGLVLTTLDAGL